MLIGFAACTTAASSPAKPGNATGQPVETDELLARIPQVFQRAETQYEFLLTEVDPVQGSNCFPRSLKAGALKLVAAEDWTSGFFPGTLWYLYEYTGAARWKTNAARYTERLEKIQHFNEHHDVGFMLGSSYGNGYRLTQNPAYRDVLITGARSLSTRYHDSPGLIRSWSFGQWKYPVIIDNMMNLELLMWANRETGEAAFRDISVHHADKTLQNHFRSNGSCFHLVDYNPTNGTVVKRQTVQGAANGSAWARGQSWALYGFGTLYRDTHNPAYLAQAEKVARFIINHPRLPSDKVPYWDFDATNIPSAPRDASAAAVMACGFLQLSEFTEPALAQQCREIARQQLLSLASPAYLAEPRQNGGFLLRHSVGDLPKHNEIDAPLNYADYYFLEALLRYQHQAVSLPHP
jgi:unsaturated chondroitin disaccharide hydrolase